MPARGTRRPNSRQARIEDWLREHPGMHRPTDIAHALGEDTVKVAWSCRELMTAGRIKRSQMAASNGGRPTGLYGIPPTRDRATTT